MHEHETDEGGRQICTTSGEAPSVTRAKQREEGRDAGQHSSYVVLCEEERAKGFVRPYRDRYRHVGRIELASPSADAINEPPLYQRVGGSGETYRRGGGCNTVTTMGRSLSETYACDPKFYSATFCVACNRHLPVGEFVWTVDGQPVGS